MCDNEDALIRDPFPSGTYVGGQFCEKDIGIDWPEPDKLPNGYSLMFRIDALVSDGVWTYALVNPSWELQPIVCENTPADTNPDGCRIGW